MRPQLIMFCFAVSIVGTMYSLIDSGVWFGAKQTNFVNQLAGFGVVNVQVLQNLMIPKAVAEWFNAIVTMISWDYPYLSNPWGTIFKIVILYPCSIGVAVSIWQIFAPVVQGLAGIVKSVLP
jgi:hypothetical protein